MQVKAGGIYSGQVGPVLHFSRKTSRTQGFISGCKCDAWVTEVSRLLEYGAVITFETSEGALGLLVFVFHCLVIVSGQAFSKTV